MSKEANDIKRGFILNHQTLIPVSALAVLFGAVWWMSSLYSQVRSMEERLKNTEQKVTSFQESSIDLIGRLVTIEVKLDELKNSLSNSTIRPK